MKNSENSGDPEQESKSTIKLGFIALLAVILIGLAVMFSDKQDGSLKPAKGHAPAGQTNMKHKAHAPQGDASGGVRRFELNIQPSFEK